MLGAIRRVRTHASPVLFARIGETSCVAGAISNVYSFTRSWLETTQTQDFRARHMEGSIVERLSTLMRRQTRGDDSRVRGNRPCPIVRNLRSDRTNHASRGFSYVLTFGLQGASLDHEGAML